MFKLNYGPKIKGNITEIKFLIMFYVIWQQVITFAKYITKYNNYSPFSSNKCCRSCDFFMEATNLQCTDAAVDLLESEDK